MNIQDDRCTGRLLLLRAAVQRYIDDYSDSSDPWVLAVEDWNMMAAMRQLLSPVISACKDLESDLSVTCSKMLKHLFRLWKYFRSKAEPAAGQRARSSAKAMASLAASMSEKLHAEIDDPNWFFTALFMAYMDPTGAVWLLCNACTLLAIIHLLVILHLGCSHILYVFAECPCCVCACSL